MLTSEGRKARSVLTSDLNMLYNTGRLSTASGELSSESSRKASCVSSKRSDGDRGQRQGEAVREGRFPLFGEPLGEAHGEKLLLKVRPAVVEDEADDGRQGHDGLHDDPGRRMDGAHEDAHGRHPEVRARELEPLRPREPRLDPARPGTGSVTPTSRSSLRRESTRSESAGTPRSSSRSSRAFSARRSCATAPTV